MARWIRLDVLWDDSLMLFDQPPGVQLAWIKLLCYAKCAGSGGRVKAMPELVAAKKWGVDVTDVTALLTVTRRDGALSCENGEWVVVNWSKYQEQDTTGKDRQRRFRERNEPQQAQPVTERNGVTPVTQGVTRHVTETETETETYKPPKGGAGGFKKPTISELSSYFQEINLSEDPQRFLDYYQANGWKVGRNPMKDWRATARQWKARRETEKAAEQPKPSRYRRVEDMTPEELEAIQS